MSNLVRHKITVHQKLWPPFSSSRKARRDHTHENGQQFGAAQKSRPLCPMLEVVTLQAPKLPPRPMSRQLLSGVVFGRSKQPFCTMLVPTVAVGSWVGAVVGAPV
jgi:hypothetical protein